MADELTFTITPKGLAAIIRTAPATLVVRGGVGCVYPIKCPRTVIAAGGVTRKGRTFPCD
jgi:hypothetical protein